MKYISLAISRLKQYCLSNKLIFSLFILGSVVCGITFIYFYGNATSFKLHENSDNYEYRMYSVKFSKEIARSEIDDEKFRPFGLQNLSILGKLYANELSGFKSDIEGRSQFLIKASVFGDASRFSSKGRVLFTDAEEKSGKPVIVIPERLGDADIGKNISIKNVRYEIIGISTSIDTFSVPLKAFEAQNMPVRQADFVFSQALTPEGERKFISMVNGLYPVSSIEGASQYRAMDKNNFPFEMLMVCFAYFVAILTFMFLMKYMLEKSSDENVVYLLVGASKKTVVGIMLVENVFLTAVTGGISILLHLTLYGALFQKINVTNHVSYSAADYLLILCMLFVVSLLVAVPFIVQYVKNSLIYSKNKFEI